MQLKTFPFNQSGREDLGKNRYGKDWPVVYLINNDTDLYIGETGDAYTRFEQHLNNSKRRGLKNFNCLFDNEFNKSSVLDIEQSLIKLCSSDKKFRIQNMNAGQSEQHNYYQREMYLGKLEDIWRALRRNNLADNEYLWLKNTELFKYSPYSTLTREQNEVCFSIIKDILDCLNNDECGATIVRGGAGTGKTIVAINTIFNLVNGRRIDLEFNEVNMQQRVLLRLKKYIEEHGDLKIGFVLPMTSIRNTIRAVFKATQNGLSAKMVLGPNDVANEQYDVLFVDEAHRLSQRKNITSYGSYDEVCKKLGLDKYKATHLDWIIKQSKYQVLFYDKYQSIKGSDISYKYFEDIYKDKNVNNLYLTTQMRCRGGSYYTEYIKDILSCTADEKREIENYDFRLFDDVDEMVNSINKLDKEMGLCRNVAGYSWKWISKGMKSCDEIRKNNKQDITIGEYKYIWNLSFSNWITKDCADDEIGCVHTSQGFDFNYAGVIFGEEIDYDKKNNQIIINSGNFYDTKVKSGVDEETLKSFIINSYSVMMTRGIRGCYVYTCNKNLREYLGKYIDK